MKRLFAILIAVLMLLSLAACGEESDKSEKATDSTSAVSEDSSNSDEDSSAIDDATEAQEATTAKAAVNSSKHYDTLEQYLDDPVNSKGLDAIKKSSEGVMDIEVSAEDGILVYDYTYTAAIDASTLPNVKATLENVLETSKDSFTELASMMQSQVDEPIALKVVYRNADGEVITERTFEP